MHVASWGPAGASCLVQAAPQHRQLAWCLAAHQGIERQCGQQAAGVKVHAAADELSLECRLVRRTGEGEQGPHCLHGLRRGVEEGNTHAAQPMHIRVCALGRTCGSCISITTFSRSLYMKTMHS